ncbi:ABC transporter permease [Neobacillus muris]|uniref:ABC transporter permease n=1 Tax=Neobacillus muris TaxID=2941334 RepID=UPI00203C560E|nr:ABC transporter permease [Neobacillus muris]
MNVFLIAWKEIKTSFRDLRTLLFLIAFPILLMLVLGTALTNAFSTSITVDEMKVLYKDTTHADYFKQFVEQAKKSGIQFKEVSVNINGKNEVKQGKYHGYIETDPNGIQLYLNNKTSIEGNILQGMLSAYVDQYNIASVIIKTNPEKMEDAFSREKQDDFIKETSLLPGKQPSSMDYYAIATTTLIILFGSLNASSLIVSERTRKTADRLIASPVSKSEIFIGKVLGGLVTNILCVLLVVFFSKLVFKANWGDHLGLVFLVLLTEIVFAVSLGIGISFLAKASGGPSIILMVAIQLAGFFGGAYYKIDNAEGLYKLLTDLSPLTWVNSSITKIIYSHDFSAAIPAIGFNLAGAIVFLLVAVISLQRREGL